MRKWLIFVAVLIIIIAVIYITISKHINESFTGYVFSNEHKLIKEVPITLEGNWNNKFGKREKFIGVINIDGVSLEIESAGIHTDIDSSKYFFTSSRSNTIKKEGINKLSTCIIISKDFKTVFGFTPELTNKYGERSYFKSIKDLDTFLDRY